MTGHPRVGDLHWCNRCHWNFPVVDSREEQIGYEERARRVWVVSLRCGHDIETPIPWSAPWGQVER